MQIQYQRALAGQMASVSGEEDHFSSGSQTPLRPDAFAMSAEEKVHDIAYHFRSIMHTLGLDLSDDSLKDTPMRVAKMYVRELFSGLDPVNKPAISLFNNSYGYGQLLLEKNIPFVSQCEHHFVPIRGKAHVAYFAGDKVIGLSKLNRIVDYFARRPQVQERLTVQIGQELQQVLSTEDVAVIIDAEHMCVSMRGIRQDGCSTVSSFYGGRFNNASVKNELLLQLK